MTLQLVLQGHRLHPVADQILWIFADLAVEPWILQRRPCLRDRPLFGAQPWKGSGNPQRPNVIAGRPSGFELAEFGFGGHGWRWVAGCDLGMLPPVCGKAFYP
jgi:hypothetical protein